MERFFIRLFFHILNCISLFFPPTISCRLKRLIESVVRCLRKFVWIIKYSRYGYKMLNIRGDKTYFC
jgi:hypothetical protein